MPEVTAGGGVISAVGTSSCRFKLSRVDSGLPPHRGYLPSLLSSTQILVAAWAPLRFFYADQKFSRSFSGGSSACGLHCEAAKQEYIKSTISLEAKIIRSGKLSLKNKR